MPPRNSGRRSGNGTEDMTRIDIDPRTAERLVAGSVAGADLPRGGDGVVRVLSAARQAATESDLSAMDATVAAMVGAALASGNAVASGNAATEGVKVAAAPPARRIGLPSWVPKLLPVSVAGCTAVFGALAAAGALPSSAQRPVADIVSYVGIDLPRPADPPKSPEQPAATTSTSSSTTTVVPGETTDTTAVTSETTIAAPPCAVPAVITASGCLQPEPQSPTTTLPTTSTTQPPPPTTVVPTTTTAVPPGGGQGERSSGSGSHSGTGDPGLS